MEILQSIVVILFFLVSAVLIFLVLIQSGKGGSLGVMGGGSSSTAFGSSTVDVVEKATYIAAVAFFVLAIVAAIAFADSGPEIPLEAESETENLLLEGETPEPAAETETDPAETQDPAGL